MFCLSNDMFHQKFCRALFEKIRKKVFFSKSSFWDTLYDIFVMILKQYRDVGCQIRGFRGRPFHFWGLNCVLSEQIQPKSILRRFFHTYLNFDYYKYTKRQTKVYLQGLQMLIALSHIPFKQFESFKLPSQNVLSKYSNVNARQV